MVQTCDTVLEDGSTVCSAPRPKGARWCSHHKHLYDAAKKRHTHNKAAARSRRRNRKK
jgi:hypothetical protein